MATNDPNTSPDKLVTLVSFTTPLEAAMARSRLEGEGIRAFLNNEHLIAADVFLTNATGGVKVKVAASDLALAKEILEARHELEAEDRDEDDGYADEPYRCPKCHTKEVDLVPLGWAALAFTILLLGWPLMVLPRRKRCRRCDHTG